MAERWVCWEAVVAYFKVLSRYLPEEDIGIPDPRAWNRTRNLEYETRGFLVSQKFWLLLLARRTFKLLRRDRCVCIFLYFKGLGLCGCGCGGCHAETCPEVSVDRVHIIGCV